MIVPNAGYRANPARAIHISGVIDGDLVTKITPQILWLQSQSRAPLTIYIDSPGGNVAAMEMILRLLRFSDQDGSAPCRIITVVTNHAASAAADLLSAGDYALALPTSSILYHGMRRQADSLPPLTAEISSFLGKILRLSNDRYAMELARKIEDRFSFRFMTARGGFAAMRRELAKPDLSDLDCFIEHVARRLSTDAKKLWERAQARHKRYKSLFAEILRKTKGDVGKLSRAAVEAKSLKAIVDFELKANKNKPKWTFAHDGLDVLADDFLLLNEYLDAVSHERLRDWSVRFGSYVLDPAEAEAIGNIADDNERTERLIEKARPIFEPLWTFFVALCHALQNDENELTAHDAYWLGLVDEVVGEHMLSPRLFVEQKPDPVPEAAVPGGDAAAPQA